jgi:DNA polymerase-3 subunit epsilon
LLDAELLAEVYVELIGARQAMLGLAETMMPGGANGRGAVAARVRPQPLPPRVSAEEQDAHAAFVATLGEKPLWQDYS